MAKSETRVKDEFQNWKEVTDEAFFSNWKDDGGIKGFNKLKIVRDGKPLIESEFSDRKRPQTIDPKLFEKPAAK